jgi:hypothetical protein
VEIDESDLSEITILPDGRVYAFGITRQVVDLLKSLESRDDALRQQPASEAAERLTAARVHSREETP